MTQTLVRHDRGVDYHILYRTKNVKRVLIEYLDPEDGQQKKMVLSEGEFTVELTQGSWKYGPEIQFIYHTPKAPEIKPRVNEHNGRNRSGVYFTPQEVAKMFREVKM